MIRNNSGRTSKEPIPGSLSTRKAVKLFLASALMIGGTAGCSGSGDCVDQNGDGYCDNGSGGGARSGYYGSGGGSGKAGTTSGISSGSHGGIGSSGHSSS